MSIYKNETIDNFKTAIESVLNQTIKPDEIVLVRDGKVSDELQYTIDHYVEKFAITYLPLEKNQGLGRALAYGLEHTKNDIVARMDTDDICMPNRFELQMAYINAHPEADVVGGQIIEFLDNPNNQLGIRNVPLWHGDICEFMKRRNPFNHMTVVFKKSKVIAAGNYQDMHFVEDYYLWCRMALMGCEFANVPDVVVLARTGKDMYKRRGGLKYFKSWKAIEKFKLNCGMTSLFQYLRTLTMRFGVQVLCPGWLRGIILVKFSRKQLISKVSESNV